MAPAIEAVRVLSPLRAGTGNATRVSPARVGRSPVDRWIRAPRKASARPGGREAPAVGGAGAGRGLWPPAGKGQRGAVAGAMAPAIEAVRVLSPLRAGKGNATLVSHAHAGRFFAHRQVREHRQASARPGGRWPGALGPGWTRARVALWQGRWPLPGCSRRTQVQEFPAFRSGSPCGRHLFRTPLTPGRSGWGCARGQAPRTHNR